MGRRWLWSFHLILNGLRHHDWSHHGSKVAKRSCRPSRKEQISSHESLRSFWASWRCQDLCPAFASPCLGKSLEKMSSSICQYLTDDAFSYLDSSTRKTGLWTRMKSRGTTCRLGASGWQLGSKCSTAATFWVSGWSTCFLLHWVAPWTHLLAPVCSLWLSESVYFNLCRL